MQHFGLNGRRPPSPRAPSSILLHRSRDVCIKRDESAHQRRSRRRRVRRRWHAARRSPPTRSRRGRASRWGWWGRSRGPPPLAAWSEPGPSPAACSRGRSHWWRCGAEVTWGGGVGGGGGTAATLGTMVTLDRWYIRLVWQETGDTRLARQERDWRQMTGDRGRMTWDRLISVPARLGKGQGAREIGHNLVREQPKFGHSLVRKRHKTGHSLEHEWLCVNDQNSVTIQHANETMPGHNFVGDRWKHGHKSASIFTSAVRKHNSNYILLKGGGWGGIICNFRPGAV